MNIKKMLTIGAMMPMLVIAEEQQQVTVSEESAESANADVQVELSAADTMQQLFDEFAASKGDNFAYGLADKKTGAVYFCAAETLSVGPASNMFIQKRQLAFEKAFNRILFDFVKYRTGINVTETLNETLSDDSSNVLETPKNLKDASTGIAKKLKVATEAAIDKGLRALDVDPSKYASKPLEEKRQTYLDSIMKNGAVRAVGSTVGVTVVKTMETHSADQVYVIGVIAKYDPLIEDVARCIAREVRPNVELKKGISAASLMKKPAEELVQNFGLRYYYNEEGVPEIISFGQWSTGYTGKDVRKQDRKNQIAAHNAELLALQAMTEFIGGSIALEEEGGAGNMLEEANVFDEEGGFREDNFDEVVSKYRSKCRVTGKAKMRGRAPIDSPKFITHPSGQKVALFAVRYSFDVLDSVKNPKSKKTATQPKVPVVDEGTSGKAEGTSYDF